MEDCDIYYNKGNNCDECINQYLGSCIQYDQGLECEFILDIRSIIPN